MANIYVGSSTCTLLSPIEALKDPQSNYISIQNGAISFADAKAIRDLFMSPTHKSKWELDVADCFPDDRETELVLREAFSKCKIGELLISELYSPKEKYKRMLTCIFETRQSMADINTLKFYSCVLDFAVFQMIKRWARCVRVQELNLSCTRFNHQIRPNGYFLSAAFEEAPRTPRCLTMHKSGSSTEACDLSRLRDLESLNIYGSQYVGSVCGLHRLVHLRSLGIDLDDSHITLEKTGLIGLLDRDECGLEELHCDFDANHARSSVASLLDAMKSNRSVQKLTLWPEKYDDYIMSHVVDCLKENKGIKRFRISQRQCRRSRDHPANVADMVHVMSTVNTTVVIPTVDCASLDMSALAPYSFRNWCGRRLLQEDENRLPSGLWPIVFARIQPSAAKTLYERSEMTDGRANLLCADALYHLLFGVLPSLSG